MIVCSFCWEKKNQWTKFVFDDALVLTTRWLCLKMFAEKTLNGIPKFGLQAWTWPRPLIVLSMTNCQLFEALKEQHVAKRYIALLRAIYFSQTGSVYGGRHFDLKRGVRPGDIHSPLLFNAAPEYALRKRKGKCGYHGIAMDHHERLTNMRYADDLML